MRIFKICAIRVKRLFKRELSKRETGIFGESVAANYLKEKKMKIVQRNWRDPRCWGREIDIIAKDKNVLVFVEVKTRKEGSLVPGYYSVGAKKKERLCKACKAYIRQCKDNVKQYRFDVMEVRLCQNDDYHVIHYANVPLFPKHF